MPVTVMLTPWLVYTAEEVTVRVIVLRESLQRLHQISLCYCLIGQVKEIFSENVTTQSLCWVLGNFSCR